MYRIISMSLDSLFQGSDQSIPSPLRPKTIQMYSSSCFYFKSLNAIVARDPSRKVNVYDYFNQSSTPFGEFLKGFQLSDSSVWIFQL
ncbi:hypothetical protein BT96DRAFT_105115 [Gymnopus androsaceus JB14]|uniref:Uncharacterized protein n=1 Tax=Gymnopus androsaceus JB14 TaxID=1447944 RepID=A0A6A4ICM5_9AGAR|nr:hypothetical protein BT96DRAFT_105115 [Gymnopus androsaceus JB14]